MKGMAISSPHFARTGTTGLKGHKTKTEGGALSLSQISLQITDSHQRYTSSSATFPLWVRRPRRRFIR